MQRDLDLELDLSDDQCAGAAGIDLTAAKSKGAGALGGEGSAQRCSSEAPKSAEAAWFNEKSEAGGAEAEVSSSSSSSSSRFLKSLHGLNHVLCAVAPLFVLCDPGDIGAWKDIKAYGWTLATLFNSLCPLSLSMASPFCDWTGTEHVHMFQHRPRPPRAVLFGARRL